MFQYNRRSLWLAVVSLAASVILCGVLPLSNVAAPPEGKGGGKGGGGDDPPAQLPPVRYRTHFFSLHGAVDFDITGMNNRSQVVGRLGLDLDGDGVRDEFRAFLYDPEVDADAIDLNAIVPGIEDNERFLTIATAINEWGDIVGTRKRFDDPSTLQAVMIDMNATDEFGNALPPQFYPIPDDILTSIAGPRWPDMNDLGDIAARYQRDDGTWGVYIYNFGLYDPALGTPVPIDLGVDTDSGPPEINNPGPDRGPQVVGMLDTPNSADSLTAFRLTLGVNLELSPPEIFEPVEDPSTGNLLSLLARDLNHGGEFCGRAFITYPKKIKGRDGETLAFVMGDALETFDTISSWANSINGSSDFLTVDGELYHRDWGALSVIDLLDPDDGETVIWTESVLSATFSELNDRDTETEFPQICGVVGDAENNNGAKGNLMGFVLTPVPWP